jgi:hypothetical protein
MAGLVSLAIVCLVVYLILDNFEFTWNPDDED